MSITVDIAFVQQFNSDVLHLAQQKGSRFRNAVRFRQVKGKYAHFERLAAGAMFTRTSRHQDTALGDLEHSRRRVKMTDYERGELVDEEDDIRMLIDADNEYALALGMAAGRQFDDDLVTAIFGNAISVDETDTETTVPLPAGQKVGVAASGMTLAKVLNASRLLNAAEIDDDDRFLALQSIDLEEVLSLATFTSIDFVTQRNLMDAAVTQFAGFKWIRSERTGDDGAGDNRVMCWQKNAVGLAVGKEINTSFDRRPDKSNSTQVLVKMTIGAVRIEDEGVVEVATNN